ncbi:MAG: hypothetical protein IKG70_02575 [Lachnospiraceae bacterium]|nr:hypothetical protein [Lachnospiraceae bacterium]
MQNSRIKILICSTALTAAMLLAGCGSWQTGTADPAQANSVSGSTAEGSSAQENNGRDSEASESKPKESKAPESSPADYEAFAVKTELKELTLADPEKGIGVYGRYTELTAEGEVPEVLSKTLAEVNARAKESVETKARLFLDENNYPVKAAGAAVTDRYRYRNISYIVNVTRADGAFISFLETEMEDGIGDTEGERIDAAQNCCFHSSVYDTQSGRLLAPEDFLQDPDSLPDLLEDALANKYETDGLYPDAESETPAWTADYLGLRFYFDGGMIPEEKRQANSINSQKAVHVSIPYTALDGPLSETAAAAPESFIAQLEKNTEYALPHDNRVIRIEKAEDSGGREAYRIVIKEDKDEKAWWLEYADDDSDFYVFRAQDGYYFYRLEDAQDRAYVYNFARPDGGFDRFENQNAQCFDSFLHELRLAVPFNPECCHMREKPRSFMKGAPGLSTSFSPNGHYAFRPEPGRGRTWLHFALIDDRLALDSRNVGCRLLHEVHAAALDEDGKQGEQIVIPAGEVLKFLRVEGEGEMYYYMSTQYSSYLSEEGYGYDCELRDGRQVRLFSPVESSFYTDGMYLERIGEAVTLGASQYEAGLGEVPDHYVEIGGKEYKLIRDLSLRTEAGEEIDFQGDIWWKVENYIGTFSSEEEDAELVISENGEVRFEYQESVFTGKLPEKRYYRSNVAIRMEAERESRTFQIIVEDPLPDHDPTFNTILFYSEGEPATNEPSHVPPVEVELVREAG